MMVNIRMKMTNGSATEVLNSLALWCFLFYSGETAWTEQERNFMCSFWQQESKCNGWMCLNCEPEGPKEEQEGGSRKEVMSICCTTEVVMPAMLEQETRCVLDTKVNICGVLVFRRDKNWDFKNLAKESGCFDVEVALVCSGTDVFVVSKISFNKCMFWGGLWRKIPSGF